MTLGEKIRYLREVEGSLRGMDRPLTQQELTKGIAAASGKTLSQSYLSQIECGKRPHMTQSSRGLLAQFFKVHPGFLVSDPEVSEVLSKVARDHDTRRRLLLLGEILNTPGLADRLFEALGPERACAGSAAPGRRNL